MADDYDDNLVPFPKGQFEKSRNERESALDELLVRPQYDREACDHDRSWVNEAARTVSCRDCGVALDPIHVLARLARGREHLVMRGRSLRAEAERLGAQVERLRRDEANAKARLRRAEHPALREARRALHEAETTLWDLRYALGDADPRTERVTAAWIRCRNAAAKLRPSEAADSA